MRNLIRHTASLKKTTNIALYRILFAGFIHLVPHACLEQNNYQKSKVHGELYDISLILWRNYVNLLLQ